MSLRSAKTLGIAMAFAALAAVAVPSSATAQQTTDSPAAVSIDGNVVTLVDGTEVELDPGEIAAIEAALADAEATDSSERLREAIVEASGGTAEGLAAAAAYAASRAPTLASAIAVVTIRRCGAPDRATRAVANLINTAGVEPNRVAAAIDAADDVAPGCRQAALDGLAAGGAVAGGPPGALPTLPQQALTGRAIDTSDNPAQDNATPFQ